MSFFRFIEKYKNLGVGTGDLGLLQFQALPIDSNYLGNTGRRKWNVQRSLGPVNAPGLMMLNGAVVPVSLLGNGTQLAGQYALQPLASNSNEN